MKFSVHPLFGWPYRLVETDDGRRFVTTTRFTLTWTEEGVPTARTTLREHVIDGGIPTAALTVTRLHMDAPGEWEWL